MAFISWFGWLLLIASRKGTKRQLPRFGRKRIEGFPLPDLKNNRNEDSMEFLSGKFFERSPVICARELIGCEFLWRGCAGRIVETEAYLSIDDEACHTWSRPSSRAFVENHEPGDAYVYLNYGIHWMFNVLAKSAQGSGFILFRALEAASGIENMRGRRPGVTDAALASGPGKLTRALGIDGNAHGVRFLEAEGCGIRPPDAPVQPAIGPRIGITKAVDLPWRFGDSLSRSLSRKFPR